jgi:hypothetical protein
LEILIALGLFAVVISGLIALFPVALHSEKESIEETRALVISSGVMEILNSGEGHGALRFATGMSHGIPLLETISSGKNTNFSIAYDASCEPIRKLTTIESASPLADPAAAVVTLSLLSKPSLPGLITAEVAVATPSSAPAASRSIRRFTRLIATPLP